MALISELHNAWRRLYTRYAIKPTERGALPVVSEMITPTTDFDQLLKLTTQVNADGDLSGAAGSYLAYFTVPAGQRWTLKQVWISSTTLNTRLRINIGGNQQAIGTNTNAERVVVLYDIQLNERDSIGLTTTGDAGDASRPMALIYEEEEAY